MTSELNGFVSKACGGERCHCGEPAVRKVGEEILFDDPMPRRHNLTAYICARHYAELMGPLGAQHVGYTRPPVPDKQLTDVVEKCRDRFAEYVELHRAKLTDDAVLNVREAIWRKVEHNQEMVRMCDEALASLNTRPLAPDKLTDVVADRDEWKTQHENLLGIHRAQTIELCKRTQLLRRSLAYLASTLGLTREIRDALPPQGVDEDIASFASLASAPAGDDVIARALAEADGYDFDKLAHPHCLTSPRMNSKGHWLHLARAALKATTHTEEKA
jgi:hypothetical protein